MTDQAKHDSNYPKSVDNLEIVVIEREKVQPIERRWLPDDKEHFESRKIGPHRETKLRVVMVEPAWLDAFDHAAKNLHVEIGGVLLGNYCKDQAHEFVLIQQILRAERNESFGGALVFTVEALIELDKNRERDFPELRVVGWYHSHPGFGVFYSSIDAESHCSQFTQPFHVGMVVDPLGNDAGFFVWQDTKLTGPHGFWVVKPLTPQSPEKAGNNREHREDRRPRVQAQSSRAKSSKGFQ